VGLLRQPWTIGDESPRELGLEEDLELYILGRLERTKVSALESHLLECQQCRLKLSDAAIFERQLADIAERQTAYKGPEKRSQPRTPTLDTASIRVLSPVLLERCAEFTFSTLQKTA